MATNLKHLREPMKKWASEPTLLGDYGDEWINEWDNKEENGVSFTQEVARPSLDNVTKQRVQLRPKRRPPSRGFVKSMANLDFDISFPEEIKEEDEEEEEEDTEEDSSIGNDAMKTPAKPKVAPKPSDQNGAWKLPTIDSNVLLKKTSSSNSKSNDSIQEEDNTTKIPSDPEDPVTTPEPPPVPQQGKPRRRSKRFKFHLFKFRGKKENGKKYETGQEGIDRDTNGNLADSHCMSVDSGKLPLGEEAPRAGWRYRRRRKSEGERRRLSWLMQLFHVKNAAPEAGNNATETSAVAPLPSNGNHGNTNGSEASGVEKDKKQPVNGHVSAVKTESRLTPTDASDREGENPESVSDLRKKFERISAAF